MKAATRVLEVRFDSRVHAIKFARSCVSLFYGVSRRVVGFLASGTRRDGFLLEEALDALQRGSVASLSLNLHEPALEVELRPTLDAATVTIRAPFASGASTTQLWLQCDPEFVAPIPAIQLATIGDRFALESAHAFVGLALRCGGFLGADLVGEHALRWSTTMPEDVAQPVQSALRDAVWTTAARTESAPAVWVSGLPTPSQPTPPEAGWWEQYDVLTRRPSTALAELQAHLAAHVDIPGSDLPDPRRNDRGFDDRIVTETSAPAVA